MIAKNEEYFHKPLGGKVIVLGVYVRYILAVVKNGTKYDIFKATINSSKLCKHCKVMKLSENIAITWKCSKHQRICWLNLHD